MNSPNLSPRAAVGSHPIYSMLAAFPAVCFTLTLATDIAYWQTANLMWQRFAEWLLLVGTVVGAVAVLVGAIARIVRSRSYVERPTSLHLLGNVVVLVLAVVNSLVHARDGWTGVVPEGLILSAVTVAVMILTAWIGHAIIVRHQAGVRHYA